MKKEYFYAIGAFVIVFFISIFLICGMKVNAEENTTTEDNTSEVSNTEEDTTTTEEENTDIVNNEDNVSTDDDNVSTDDDNLTTEEDEDATFTEMLESFLDKWLMPIIVFIAGIAGTAITNVVMKKVIEKIIDKITKAADKTEQEKRQEIANVLKVKTTYENLITVLQNLITILNESNANSVLNTESAQALLESLAKKENQEGIVREVLALMAAGISELQRNGTATQVIELLQDTLTTTDDKTDSTEEEVTEEDTTTTKEV